MGIISVAAPDSSSREEKKAEEEGGGTEERRVGVELGRGSRGHVRSKRRISGRVLGWCTKNGRVFFQHRCSGRVTSQGWRRLVTQNAMRLSLSPVSVGLPWAQGSCRAGGGRARKLNCDGEECRFASGVDVNEAKWSISWYRFTGLGCKVGHESVNSFGGGSQVELTRRLTGGQAFLVGGFSQLGGRTNGNECAQSLCWQYFFGV